MKGIKFFAFIFFLQAAAVSAFATTVVPPTAQQYLSNTAYCAHRDCTAADIATGDGGTSFWLCPIGYHLTSNGICIPPCTAGYIWQNDACVPQVSHNACISVALTIADGGSAACPCSGSTVNLATCTCHNGTISKNETQCGKFTKYRVCPGNPCSTQSGSCYKNSPGDCVWNSCPTASVTTSSPNAANTAGAVTKSIR